MMRVACLALFALAAVPAQAADHGLCTALAELRREARDSRTEQKIAIMKQEPMSFGCDMRREIAAQAGFCSAAGEAVSIEFTHAFPWQIYECLRAEGVRPDLTLLDQYTGLTNRRKITRLSGKWKDGMRIEIRFEPTGDDGDEPQFKDYWGNYRLVVSER